MEKNNKEKGKLNDELLDQVSGGYSECNETTYYCNPEVGGCGNSFKSWTIPDYCVYCAQRGTLVEK